MNWPTVEGDVFYWISVLFRIIWCVIAARATYRAYHEYRLNKDAYQGGRYLRDGKRIVRRGRFLRSRWFFIAFSIALFIGVVATIAFFIIQPLTPTTLIQIFTTSLIIVMLYGFDQAKEADIDMRHDAREYKRVTGEYSVEQRVGEEIIHPPVDIKEQAEEDYEEALNDDRRDAESEQGDDPSESGHGVEAFGEDYEDDECKTDRKEDV